MSPDACVIMALMGNRNLLLGIGSYSRKLYMYRTPGMWGRRTDEIRPGCAGLVDQLMVETRAQYPPLLEQGVSSRS